MIAEAAVAAFLSPDDGERREAAITKRLDQIDRRIARIERDWDRLAAQYRATVGDITSPDAWRATLHG